MKNILFVCTGNICRSPMAEGLLRGAAKGRNDIEVGSAGVSACEGQPASHHAVEACRMLGLDISDQFSAQLDDDAVSWATHIFVMTRGHFETIRLFFPEAESKVRLVGEFLPRRNGPPDIPDPIGLGLGAYIECRDALRAAMPGILKFIDQDQAMSTTTSPSQPTPSMPSQSAGNVQQLRVAIGSDHAGLELKQAVLDYLTQRGDQ